MVQPAFASFFMGEDFIYLTQYYNAGQSYWGGVLSPTTSIFFRPAFSAINLLWMFSLPVDPFVHQIRNVVFSILNMVLLDRVFRRLGVTRWARWIGVAFFAISKIHLTAIGYINVYDSIVSLSLILLAILFFVRYSDERRLLDYAFGLLFTFVAIFTKDYGLVVVAVIAALVLTRDTTRAAWSMEWRGWLWRLVPLVPMVLVYLAIRFTVVGSLPGQSIQSSAYRPALTLDVVAQKLLVFTSTMANLSFEAPRSGAGGLGLWLSQSLPAAHDLAGWIDGGLYLAFLALALIAIAGCRRALWPLIFPLVWIGAYVGPTLLTRTMQMYYMYEPLAGVAALLAVCLSRASRGLLVVWSGALILIGLNGAISNVYSTYDWQAVTTASRRIREPILDAHRGEPLESITLVTANPGLWQYILAADGSGRMIQMMMNRPSMDVRIIDYGRVPAAVQTANSHNLIFDIDNGFVELDVNRRPPPLVLRSISPRRVQAGTGFNVQPDGRSTMVLAAENVTAGTVLVLDAQRLDSDAAVADALVFGLIPQSVLGSPGTHTIYLSNGLSESNRLTFDVTADPPPAESATNAGTSAAVGSSESTVSGPLRLKQVEPPTTRAGQPFGVQSNGLSTLSLVVENARAGAVVFLNNTPLMTWYNPTLLVAEIPAELYRQPGRYDVYVKQDGAESERIQFVVEP